MACRRITMHDEYGSSFLVVAPCGESLPVRRPARHTLITRAPADFIDGVARELATDEASLAIHPSLPDNRAPVRRQIRRVFRIWRVRQSLRISAADRHPENVGIARPVAVIEKPLAIH